MKLRSALITLAPMFFLTGCMYGYSIDSESTIIGTPYSKTSFVDVYFGEYRGGKQYEQIAFIRALGEKYSKTPELMDELRRKARSLGADAIIEIQTSNTQRDRGSVFFNLVDMATSDGTQTREEDSYNAPVLSGIAVKYID